MRSWQHRSPELQQLTKRLLESALEGRSSTTSATTVTTRLATTAATPATAPAPRRRSEALGVISQLFDPVPNHGNRDRRHVQLTTTTGAHLLRHHRRRRWPHQLRHHDGVEQSRDTHDVTSAARTGVDRNGNSNSTPPTAPNRSSNVVNKPSELTGSLTASTRIARISASIDRPCRAARRRKRRFTSTSKFRILTAATRTTHDHAITPSISILPSINTTRAASAIYPLGFVRQSARSLPCCAGGSAHRRRSCWLGRRSL